MFWCLPWWPDVTIVQSDVTIVIPWQLSTGSIHNYLLLLPPNGYSIWGTENSVFSLTSLYPSIFKILLCIAMVLLKNLLSISWSYSKTQKLAGHCKVLLKNLLGIAMILLKNVLGIAMVLDLARHCHTQKFAGHCHGFT